MTRRTFWRTALVCLIAALLGLALVLALNPVPEGL